jgi:hypothetical protein
MDGPRRSERKRTQTDFLGATETLRDARSRGRRDATSRARAAAIAAAYEFFAGAADSDSRAEDGHLWCMSCSYQVHGKGKRGGQRPDFATTERPNDRCSGCAGCSPVRR